MIDENSLKIFDVAEYLDTDESIQIFLNDAFETKDPKYIAKAIGTVARAKGIAELARKTGICCEQLCQELSEDGDLTLQTLVLVLSALGLTVCVSVFPQNMGV